MQYFNLHTHSFSNQTDVFELVNQYPQEFLDSIPHFTEIKDKIVFAVHPRTYKTLNQFGISLPANVVTTEPLGYLA